MAKTVILGAGPTGISAAYHLEQAGFYDYVLFEKENEPGGLCRSIIQDGFTFDFTGHLLHINDGYFHSLIQSVVGLDLFENIYRRSFVYSHETYTAYPFQIHLKGLPTNVIAECVIGFIQRLKKRLNPRTFREWVLKEFGYGFGKHFFFPYQKKIFACSINKLTASWTNRFVPKTTIDDILNGIMFEPLQNTIGYNAQFLYPKEGGIVTWVKKLANQLHNPIQLDHTVTKIDLATQVIHFNNGHQERYNRLITTIPLDILLHCLREKPSTNFKKASPHLLCNSVINFNLGFKRPDISDKHWIYFPESKFPFYRLGFPHNFSQGNVPSDCSSLYGECAFLHKSASSQLYLLEKALTQTKALLKISDDDIATQKVITIPHAYVIYDAWRDKHLSSLLAQLQQQNIYSVGRYGEWKYSSMQEAILDGKNIATTISSL